jgi:hypothetical protein
MKRSVFAQVIECAATNRKDSIAVMKLRELLYGLRVGGGWLHTIFKAMRMDEIYARVVQGKLDDMLTNGTLCVGVHHYEPAHGRVWVHGRVHDIKVMTVYPLGVMDFGWCVHGRAIA